MLSKIAIWLLLLVIAGLGAGCVTTNESAAETVVIFGASGRIGAPITTEALAGGYDVIGVSRNPVALQERFPDLRAMHGDILDRDRTQELLRLADVVVVSIGGKPTSTDPEEYVVYQATEVLIDVLSSMPDGKPRLIMVGNLFTLEVEPGVTLLDAGRADAANPNFPMFVAHQLALDKFRATTNIDWSIASPPNGFRLQGRTGNIVWGENQLLLGDDGKALSISLEDYAFAVVAEIRERRFSKRRFAVARENTK